MIEKDILDFIEVFQSESNMKLFKECACYWFSHILTSRFAAMTIYYNPDAVHFAAYSYPTQHLYDISGVIEDSSGYVGWKRYQMEHPEDIDLIIENCIQLER